MSIYLCVCWFVCLLDCLFVGLVVSWPSCLLAWQSVGLAVCWPGCLLALLSVGLALSVNMSVFLSFGLIIFWPCYLLVWLCLSICWPDSLLVSLSIGWTVYLSLSVSLYACLSVDLKVCLSNIHSSACQADCTCTSSVQLRGVCLLFHFICPSPIFLSPQFIPAVCKITQTLWRQHTKLEQMV